MVTGVLKCTERKCVIKSGWLQILTSEKCTIPLREWMGCLRVSLEIIMEPLKKRTIETNFFENKHTSAERTAQTMDDCKLCLENKYSVA